MTTEIPLCTACKKAREKEGLPPRQMILLPQEIFRVRVNGKPLFNNESLPGYLCEFCDGDALELSRTTFLKRANG